MAIDSPPVPYESPSLSSLIQARQQAAFVGRTEELSAFCEFLARGAADPAYAVIFSIHGQSGAGKSWLLRHLQSVAQEQGLAAPWIDQGDRDVVEVMRHIAIALDAKKKFKKYLALDKRYQQLKSEISNDPKAPEGVLSFLAHGVAKGAVVAAREAVPGTNVALEFLDEERVTEGASEYLAYLARKARSQDSVALLRRPLNALTPRFLDGLHSWGRDGRRAVIHIDGYERLRPYLDAWLRGVLNGEHGEPPLGIRFAIAGQDPLNDRDWMDFVSLVERRSLGPFTVQEARSYLQAGGIVDVHAQDRLMNKTGRLPMALAMLGPGSDEDNADPTSLAEAYVGSIDDPALRALVLRCSLVRVLNQDVVTRLSADDDADPVAHWDWLRRQRFVEQHRDGWTLHETARNALSELQRIDSPETFARIHAMMAEHYKVKLRTIAKGADAALTIAGRRALLELYYHGLCSDFEKQIGPIVRSFANVVRHDQALAYQIATAVSDAHLSADVRESLDPGDLQTVADPDLTLPASLPAITRLTTCNVLPPPARIGLLNLRAEWLERLEYFELAFADSLVAESWAPPTNFLLVDQARLLIKLGRHDEALPKLEAVLGADGGDPRLRAHAVALRARIVDVLAGPKQALTNWKDALALRPDSGAALMNYGMALLRVGQPLAAIEYFQKAGIADSELRSIALARIAEGHRRAGSPDRARALLEHELREQPTDTRLWSFFVDQLVYAGLSEDQIVDRLLSIDCHDQHEARFAQADSVAHVAPARGAALLREVLQNRIPTWSEHNQLGLALNAAGMPEAAYAEFNLALESDPESLHLLYNRVVAAKLRWGPSYEGPEIDALDRAVNRPYQPASLPQYARAGMLAISDRSEEAIDLLAATAQTERAVLEWINGDAAWARCRSDPRVTALIGDFLLVGDVDLRES